MRLPQSILVLAAVAVAAAASTTFAKAPAKAAICQSCHGPDGAKPIMSTYPRLAGQNKDYLKNALHAYKDGKRGGGMSAVMSPQAASLSDADIDALATFFSKQKP